MPTPESTQLLNPLEILAKAQLTEGMSFGDLGVGNLGYFVIPAAKMVGKSGKVYVVDIQKSVLDAVRGKAKLEGLTNLEMIWANLEKVGSVNIPADSLDAALLVNILHQNKLPGNIIQEAVRLLKPGGRLIVIDWKKTGVPFGPAVDIRIDPLKVKEIAQNLNLQLIEETEFGDYFWGLIFIK